MRKDKCVKGRVGTLFIVFGAIFLLSAISLFVYNRIDDSRAEKVSEDIISELNLDMDNVSLAPEALLYKDMSMMAKEIDNERYIGIIYIPASNIMLPVNAKCDLGRLKKSPCCYAGNYKTDDMVICAHNYKAHFGPLLSIEPGAEVIFINTEGLMYRYRVSYIETLPPDSALQMTQNRHNSPNEAPNADWELTLYTCHLGGRTRCTVRCCRI